MFGLEDLGRAGLLEIDDPSLRALVPLPQAGRDSPSRNRRRTFHDVLQFSFVCLWDDGFDMANDLGVFQVLGETACVSQSSVKDLQQGCNNVCKMLILRGSLVTTQRPLCKAKCDTPMSEHPEIIWWAQPSERRLRGIKCRNIPGTTYVNGRRKFAREGTKIAGRGGALDLLHLACRLEVVV